jgi:hypothetical protein
VEIARRLGAPALVLVPNSAVQAQWLQMVARFTPAGSGGVVRSDLDAPVACLTYQAFCQVDDPAAVLGTPRSGAGRPSARRPPAPRSRRSCEACAWEGAAATRRRRELARITAAIKRETARGEHAGLGLDALLSAPVRRRIQALRMHGVATLVLDECHRLASLWGTWSVSSGPVGSLAAARRHRTSEPL